MHLNRSIGLVGLTFIALSGMLGSGWLFVPQLVSQLAGPAALLSWLIGAAAMLLFALCYAEISAMLPVAGGLARLPWFSHGNVVSGAMGWSAWVGYTLAAPIEVLAILKYVGPWIPFIYNPGGAHLSGGDIGLSVAGHGVAIALLALMVVINAFGVRFFANINTGLTWLKIIAPAIIAGALLTADFSLGNFTSHGFMPYGVPGIFAGVSAGGVIFAFIGFRHAIDMAGEVRNPQRNMPLALAGAVLLCLLIYLFVQVAFIGGISADKLAGGWSGIDFEHQFGPLAAIALAVGLPWLMAVIYGTAVIAPFGGGLVATGSNARLSLAMSRINFFPDFLAKLSGRGVPLNGLFLNLAVGIVMYAFLSFDALVTLNSSAIVLSFAVGPVTLYALRLQLPGQQRSFRLPAAKWLSCLAFIIAGLLLYWSGWNTLRVLGLALGLGLVLFIVRRLIADHETRPAIDLHQAWWLIPYLIAVGLTSYLGQFGGGLKIIPQYWGAFLIAVYSIFFFFLAVKQRLPADHAAANVREAEGESEEDF